MRTFLSSSSHVAEVGFGTADDRAVWDYAGEQGFVIVSRDEDFHQMAFLDGPPPKVVWVQLGNCTAADIEQAIREGVEPIAEFIADEEAAFFVLGRPTA